MDPFVIVSPHLDDAVLSCGQIMAGRPDMTVVTVFTGRPGGRVELTDFDRRSGFESAYDAVSSRIAEDRRALGMLRADRVLLPFVDDQYVTERNVTIVDEVAAMLRVATRESGAHELLAPLGLVHPDHVISSNAALQLVDEFDVWLYEELPSRVLWPESVVERVELLRSHGVATQLTFLGDGPLPMKRRAIDCYASQRWALNLHCLLVPERVHRVTSCD